jgi:hypothetical protein
MAARNAIHIESGQTGLESRNLAQFGKICSDVNVLVIDYFNNLTDISEEHLWLRNDSSPVYYL